MKKITLAIALLTFGLQAQTFPNPYCDIANGTSIEEITSVNFNTATITNTVSSSVLIDETATITSIVQNQTYAITVAGNTYGSFDTDIVAFIDWNQNSILDDANEIYAVGTLFDTTGSDGVSVTTNITVPSDAVLGETRIRITKTYQDPDSPAIVNPCAISFNPFGGSAQPGYGQALDFTVNIEAPEPFPSPYCDIPSGAVVEEITSIIFDAASITNTDATSLLIDETAIIATVVPNEMYTITVAGNTYGNFDTDIVAFIDWNQNAILDDANEVYAVGTLNNTNGSDGTSVSLDITVPTDATTGTTRIRITKTYQDPSSPAIVDPCAISFNPFGGSAQPGYGQAIDFTLNIGTLSVNQFDRNALSVYPTPIQNELHIEYASEIKAVNIYNLVGQKVYSKQTNASQLSLDLSMLASGAYIIKLVTDNGQHSFRTLKQ
ncbi:T9SS type A sorting domain-containing protein [Winogradskyella eximia]|uniref:T9SS type A sorting domain-containing protein n=1 Tax=Winogradskyella eximia TaxID=262006 RepID=UPI002491017F|nr:T9SS type A sorting domain-containing protein [Winogradskyella eximia]